MRLLNIRIVVSLFAFHAAHFALAQQDEAAREVALRSEVAKFAAAWNEREINAWASFLTADARFTNPYGYEKQPREVVADFYKLVMPDFDLKIDLTRVRFTRQGDEAIAVLKLHYLGLPLREGKYQGRSQTRDAVVSRWRLVEGRWRVFYLNETSAGSAEIIKAEKLE